MKLGYNRYGYIGFRIKSYKTLIRMVAFLSNIVMFYEILDISDGCFGGPIYARFAVNILYFTRHDITGWMSTRRLLRYLTLGPAFRNIPNSLHCTRAPLLYTSRTPLARAPPRALPRAPPLCPAPCLPLLVLSHRTEETFRVLSKRTSIANGSIPNSFCVSIFHCLSDNYSSTVNSAEVGFDCALAFSQTFTRQFG